MITLFKPNETNFDHNGLGSLDKNILETVVEEELNGLYSFVFKYPIFAPHGSEIDGQSVIRVPTPDGNQLFRVYNPIKSMGYLTIKTYHIFYDLADNIIEDTNIVGKNGQGAITQLGGATQYSHTFRFFSDIETTTNARIVRMNPVAALIDDEEDNTFISRWGGELKRNNFDVRMNKSIGTNRGKRIQHRKDLIGYEANVNWATAVTRIMPKGFNGLLLPEKYVDSPLINRYIKPKIKVVEYSDIKAAAGEYANDKDAVPLQTAYQLLRERANEEYSVNKVDIPEATYKVDFVSLDQTEEYKDLQELQKVFLGDTVTVEHKEDGLNIEAKVISYKYDPLAKKYLGLELGSFKETFTSKYSDITKLTRKVTELTQTTNFIQSTADGKNTINRGTSEPLYPNINDLWYKPNGSETELWQYVDESEVLYWKMISSTAELNALKKEVDEVINQADIDRAKMEQDFESTKQLAKQYTDAEIVKFDTKFNAETGAIRNEIQTGYTDAVLSAKNYTNTKVTEFDTQLGVIKQNVTTATNSANAAVTKADKAISEAGFAKADSATAIGIANGAVTNAANALGTAQTSLSNSGTALTNAQNALNAYNNLDISTQNLVLESNKLYQRTSQYIVAEYRISEDWIAGKEYTITVKGSVNEGNFFRIFYNDGYASFADPVYDSAKGLWTITGIVNDTKLNAREVKNMLRIYNVASATAKSSTIEWIQVVKGNKVLNGWTPAPEDVQVQITDINGELLRKVSQSTFDTLNGVVGTHTTQIGQTQTALTAKADSQLVNTIKGTVDQHTLDIAATSKGLTFKADSSRVDTIKGTVDSHTTELGIQAQAITARLTSAQVDSLVSGKNYVNQAALTATSTGLSAQISQVRNAVNNIGVWNKSYKVNATTALPLTKENGEPLDYSESYEIQGQTSGTSTPTTALVVFKSKGTANGWDLIKISEMGTVSNHPEFFIDSEGKPSVRLYGHSSNYAVYVTHRAYKGRSTPLLDSETKFTSIEATFKGLQTTVGSKAGQTQVTQLANQWTQTTELVSGHTGQISNLGEQINLRVVAKDVTEAILADKTIKDTRDENQTPTWYFKNYPKQNVEEFKRASTMGITGSTYGQLTTNVLWGDASGGAITQTFRSADGVFKRTSINSAADWGNWDKVAENGKLISQINISTEGILLQGKRIQLDGDVTMTTAFVTRLDALTLTAVYADIATVRTKFLIADLITSAYLKVDNALVDKMTATTSIVDRFFSKTAVIDNVEAKSLSAVYADIPTIRNKVLITDSVTAGMVKADAGLFDKVFINDAVVQKLTAKSSFINSVKAVDITADKISGGIFNAALMTVIGLNASDITSGTLTGANFKLNLSTGQMDVTGSKQTVRLSSSGLTMLNNSNQEVGRFITGYGSSSSDNGTLIGIAPNKAFTIGKQNSDNGAYIDVIKVRYDKDLIDINYPIDKLMIGKPTYNIEIGSDNLLAHNAEYGFRFSRYNAATNGNDGILELRANNITSWAAWNFNGWVMKNVKLEPNSINSSGSISTDGSLNVNSGSKTAQLFFGSTEAYLSADYGVVIAHKDSSGSNRAVMTFTYNNITSWANINMNGRSVTNQSDRRLKKNILDSSDDSLGAINRWTFVNYEWISLEKPGGIKLGLIAQDTPELSIYDADSDIYSIDSSKQMMMNSHAIQQLNKKVVSIEKMTNISNTLASRSFSEMQQLKNKVTELELKIKQLESVS